jgi:hypothetical protein
MAITDLSNDIQTILTTALNEVPEVGDILAGLVQLFWPATGENIWAGIEQQVAELIDEKLDQYTYSQVEQDLQGINNVVTDYLNTLKVSSTDPQLLTKWIAVNDQFLDAQPHFGNNLDPDSQQGGNLSATDTVLLLPLVAQFATLHLAHLRDGVLYGTTWGMATADVAQYQTFLTKQIAAYIDYVDEIWQTGLGAAPSVPNSTDHRTTMVFWALNNYVRSMQLNVRDSADLWPYLDPSVYPGPVGTIKLTREIFSDPEGTADNSSIVLPNGPMAPITEVTCWGGSLVNAFQVSYGGVAGPVMGAPGTSTIGRFTVTPDNPVVTVQGSAGDVPNWIMFGFQDGTTSAVVGKPNAASFDWSFAGHILSSITVTGVSAFYGTAECVVFGFRRADSY